MYDATDTNIQPDGGGGGETSKESVKRKDCAAEIGNVGRETNNRLDNEREQDPFQE